MISGKHFSYCKFVWLLAAVSSACFGKPHPKGNEIAAKLQPFVESHALAGAVTLVASKEKILDEEAVGFADVAATKPMRKDTLFWIASESKPMTSAALMMLVDEGKVNVDDPVEKYLPEFKGQMLAMEQDADHAVLRKPTHPITVREVLSHTSGLPFSSPMEKPTLDGLRLRDAVASYAMAPLEFQPGAKYRYSNAGINTAGRIIEVVSGTPYERFMDERLFKPLGMRDRRFGRVKNNSGDSPGPTNPMRINQVSKKPR
jgi:CubicO group peptidase (beta-lactamase class C family)